MIYRCIRDLNSRGVLPELKDCTECDHDGRCRYLLELESPKLTWSEWVKSKYYYTRILFDIGWQAVAGRFERRR